MSILNVLSTNSITANTSEYQVVQTGVYRVIATSASTVSFNDGPAIQVLANQPILVKGSAPGRATIVKATDSATAVYTLGTNLGEIGNTHPFIVGDYISTEDNGTSPAINSNFLSAGTVGKKITAATGSAITTDIDASSATADYVYAYSGPQAVVKRAIKITAGAANIIVEEVRVTGG